MNDPEDSDLPQDGMSLAPKAQAPASPSWRDLWTYEKETHPAFHTVPDYRAALCFFSLRFPKVQEILTDWNNN
jgi:hypothetical protein